MRRAIGCIAVILALGVGSACRRSEPDAPVPSPRAGGAPERFVPPADGRLDEAQVEMYAAVRRRVAESAPEPVVDPDAGDVLGDLTRASEAEVAAAEVLGYEASEYRWVKARVLEAQVPQLSAAMGALAGRMGRASLEMLRERREQAQEPQEQAGLDEQIAELEARLGTEAPASGSGPGSGAVEHNRRLLERLRDPGTSPHPGS